VPLLSHKQSGVQCFRWKEGGMQKIVGKLGTVRGFKSGESEIKILVDDLTFSVWKSQISS
jgi:hypothetical protein